MGPSQECREKENGELIEKSNIIIKVIINA
jgi:hypothetical protein